MTFRARWLQGQSGSLWIPRPTLLNIMFIIGSYSYTGIHNGWPAKRPTSGRLRGPMSTVETPAAAPPEPIWSLGTALLFVVLWVVLLLLISSGFMVTASALISITRDVGFEDAFQAFQTEAGTTPAQAVAGVGCAALSWAATFALIARMLKRFPPALVKKSLGLQSPTPRWSIALGIPVGLGLLVAGEILMRILDVSEDQTPIMRLLKTPWGAASIAFMALAIAPIAEELFFRGFVYPPMARRFSLGTAMACNGAVFAAVHLLTYGSELGYLPPIFLLGFVLAGLRSWTGSILPAIVAHFVFNATSLLLFLVFGPT